MPYLPVRRFTLVAIAALAVPAIVRAQPSLTGFSNAQASSTGTWIGGATSTVPGAFGNWQSFLSIDGFATFLGNPLTGYHLALGTNTFSFASNYYPLDYMGINLFLDGATLPSISGLGTGSAGSLTGDPGALTYNPYGPASSAAASMSYVSGDYVTTLTRFQYAPGIDYVSKYAVGADGTPDWNGSFDLTVVSATPEPSSIVLLATGLLAAFGLARKPRKRGT